jgi:hypothetical protein
VTGPGQARAQLAARAAAAKDRRYAALFTLATPGRADRTVVVTRATDGGWRVDIPGGARGGTADVSVARTRDGLFQCALPSAEHPVEPRCVRVAGRNGQLPDRVDPRVQHVFVDWLEILTDRQAAIAVSTARPLTAATGAGAGGATDAEGGTEAGEGGDPAAAEGAAAGDVQAQAGGAGGGAAAATGDCFSVESSSASLPPPIDVGIYCFSTDGMLTGARLGFGTLLPVGAPAPAPPAITLPGAVVDGEPLSMASPPPPPPPTSTPTAGIPTP